MNRKYKVPLPAIAFVISAGLQLGGLSVFAQGFGPGQRLPLPPIPMKGDTTHTLSNYFTVASATRKAPDARRFIQRRLMLEPVKKDIARNTIFTDNYLSTVLRLKSFLKRSLTAIVIARPVGNTKQKRQFTAHHKGFTIPLQCFTGLFRFLTAVAILLICSLKKTETMNAKLFIPVVLLLGVAATFAQRAPLGVSMQTGRRQPATSCHNPLKDSKPINEATFSVVSRGIVTIVPGKSETGCAGPIPFRIYLRRDGQVIQQGVSDTTRSVMSIEVASVLALAKMGDDLVIEPTQAGHASAKRTIRVRPVFNADLFSFLGTPKKGC